MQEPSSLLEHIAGRILEKLFSKFPTIEFAEIKICKQNPPMGADSNGACIVLSGER
jgi:dihydroneopterin aldolase